MTETATNDQGWVSLSEAATLTGYAVSTLQRLVRLRKLLARKKGQKWYIELAALTQYIDSTAPGRKPAEPTSLAPQGLSLWFPKVYSKSPLGLDALINGVQYHFVHLRLEYPHNPNERVADLAPGFPGFYSISARASVSAIRWLEQQFTGGSVRIEILKGNFPAVQYSQPIDYVCETISVHERSYVSAAFGFYKAEVKPATTAANDGGKPVTMPAQRQMPPGEWLNMDAASLCAGCSLTELRELVRDGKIVAMKRYGHWQINANSLQIYLQGNLSTVSSER